MDSLQVSRTQNQQACVEKPPLKAVLLYDNLIFAKLYSFTTKMIDQKLSRMTFIKRYMTYFKDYI